MSRLSKAITAGLLATACLGVAAYAQQPAPPPFATTKVDGTDNVYIFRNGNHQSMFVVTSDGVIATDPDRLRPPAGGGAPTSTRSRRSPSKPIKYLIYSHHHFDHIAGGKPFKDAGATIVAHKRAKERLAALRGSAHGAAGRDGRRPADTITLGGTTLELSYLGLEPLRQHARDAPAEGEDAVRGRLHPGRVRCPARGMIDFYPLEAEDSMKKVLAMDWDRLIPGHPGARRPSRHQEGRAGSADVPAGRVGGGEG